MPSSMIPIRMPWPRLPAGKIGVGFQSGVASTTVGTRSVRTWNDDERKTRCTSCTCSSRGEALRGREQHDRVERVAEPGRHHDARDRPAQRAGRDALLARDRGERVPRRRARRAEAAVRRRAARRAARASRAHRRAAARRPRSRRAPGRPSPRPPRSPRARASSARLTRRRPRTAAPGPSGRRRQGRRARRPRCPARTAAISFSIFIASTMTRTSPRFDRLTLAHLDTEHGSLHRARDRVAARRRRCARARAAPRAAAVRPPARPRRGRAPARYAVGRRARARRRALERAPARAPPPASAGASWAASSPSTSPAQVSPADELGPREDQPVQRQQGRDALDLELVERPAHARDRARPVAVPDEQLRDHRVVQADDLAALLDARVDAHAGPAGLAVARDPPRRRAGSPRRRPRR